MSVSDQTQIDNQTDVATDVLPDTPEQLALVMHNDDYTTQEFVVEILVAVLNHSVETAVSLMLDIHYNGRAVVAILPSDIATQKQKEITKLAQFEEFPLLITVQAI